jgi:L-amino acid N-acyltransferase YncA
MEANLISVRSAHVDDAAALLAIYAPFVEHTAISFELSPPSVEEFAERIRKYVDDWSWLVAESQGQILGYAYGSPHRERPAYRWSVETSAYVSPNAHRRGVGTLLYGKLLAELTQKGYCNAYAGIALPNEASVALHRSIGFAPIGVFPSIGYKFDKWHDVAWLHRRLRDAI